MSASDATEILELCSGKVKGIVAGKRGSVILQIFLRTALLYLKHLKEINRRTGETEKVLQRSLKNEALIKLLNIEKSLVFFTTSLRSNDLMMERLLRMELLTDSHPDCEHLWNEHRFAVSEVFPSFLHCYRDFFLSVVTQRPDFCKKQMVLRAVSADPAPARN